MAGSKVDQALSPLNVWVPIAQDVVAKDSLVFLGGIYKQTFPFKGGKGGEMDFPKDLLFENLHWLRRGIKRVERNRLWE